MMLSLVAFFCEAVASEPALRTPSPVIYLKANLDENQNLGWCIDTIGRGFNTELHAHSCKPRGGDVQFTLLVDTGQIQSVAFSSYCITVVDANHATVPLGLTECDNAAQNQLFDYDSDTNNIHPQSDTSLCLTVGDESRSAGPFMSRDLLLLACQGSDAELRTWLIK